MSYSSHADASNKNETETKVYKRKDPGENIVLKGQHLTKFGNFFVTYIVSAHLVSTYNAVLMNCGLKTTSCLPV